MAWSPLRLSRCRTGPAAAGFQRAGAGQGGERGVVSTPSGCEKLTMAWAALTGPMPGRSVRPGASSSNDGQQLPAVGPERAATVAQREGESPDLGVPHGLFAAGLARSSAPGQARQGGVGERAASGLMPGVVAAPQKRTQSIALSRGRGGELVASVHQNP